MKTQDVGTITSVALATATLTVMTLWSGSLEAGSKGHVLAAQIAKPKLVSHGIEMRLTAAEGRVFKAGDEPAFDLEAVNTTCDPASVTIHVAMTASSPANALSRVPRLPSMLWQKEQSIVLNPKETKVILLQTQAKLPANVMVSVSLREAGPLQQTAAPSPERLPGRGLPAYSQPGIVALSLSTAAPALQTASAR